MLDAKAIGRRLVALRGEKTQVEIAKALDISPAALSMYENGERIPRDEIKIRIADYFGVPVHEIFFVR